MTEVNNSDTSGASSEYLDISNQAVVDKRALHDTGVPWEENKWILLWAPWQLKL